MRQRNDGDLIKIKIPAPTDGRDAPELRLSSGKHQLVGEGRTRAVLICPVLKTSLFDRYQGNNDRDQEARLGEAIGLAMAIDLEIVDASLVGIAKPRPATMLGEGKLEEIEIQVRANDIDLVIVDTKLSPVQQRNLERRWKTKVLDRTGLILEIFGERAETAEGRLQVELAHLDYQKSRLVRSWTHLERQRGGFGFLGGPGETQIEADRRQINTRIAKIKRQLKKVQKTRKLHRSSRNKVPYPIVALVGYTNAGKSTLFNKLTNAGVVAKDQLFATLDPTMRALELPSGHQVILSDTVGFVSDLPHELVAAFRATLEEVVEADIILHVRDIAHENSDNQAADVAEILATLGVESDSDRRIIEAWNKIDLLDPDRLGECLNKAERTENIIAISAQNGEGVENLLALIEGFISGGDSVFGLSLEGPEGKALNWLYENCEILDRVDDRDTGLVNLRLRIANARRGKLEQKFGDRLLPG